MTIAGKKPFRPGLMAALLILVQQTLLLPAGAQMRQIHLDTTGAKDEITKISFYSPSQGYIAFTNYLGFTTDSGRTFTKKPVTLTNVDYNGYGNINLTFGFGLIGVKAFDQNTLVAYGDYGLVPAILYSADGGNSFKLVFYSQYDPLQLRTGITDMVFPQNGNTGYATDADRILKTIDGGRSWTIIRTDAGSNFNFLEAVNDNMVFAFCNNYTTNKLLRTTDGGSSWQPVPVPAGQVNYIFFLSATHGWVNMRNGSALNLYYTSDGGTTWVRKNNAAATPFTCIKMKFTNDSTGYALEDGFTILKTTDSGKVWEPLIKDNAFTYLGYSYTDLFFLNKDQFWAGGVYGFLELSANAGGQPRPKAFFSVDTSTLAVNGTVNLVNYSRTDHQYRWYVNHQPAGTSYMSSYVHDLYSASDTIQLIVSDGLLADTSTKIQSFIALPYPAPLVSSFSPALGIPGTTVIIHGQFFKDAVSVSFGGIPAASFTVVSPTEIDAVVGAGDNGWVSITTARGTGGLGGFLVTAPPVISGFSPASGAVGSTVTISGSNFGTTPAANIVYFGPVRATVVSAAANQLQVIVPTGANYTPITVTANKHIAYSTLPFIVRFPTHCSLTEQSFDAPAAFTVTGYSPAGYNVVAADFDGDGKPDLAIPDNGLLSIQRNTSSPGTITFGQAINYPIAPWNHDIAVGDLNGDGLPDLAVTNADSNTVSIFVNTSTSGAISFAPRMNFGTGGYPTSVAIGDLDGDGKADLVITNNGTNVNTFSILRNISINGQIAFSPKMDMPDGLNVHKVRIGDIDGDGRPDLLILNYGYMSSTDPGYVIYRNTSSVGNISFAPKVLLPKYSYVAADGALGDIDGDGKMDIALTFDMTYTAGANNNAIAIFLNKSTPGNIFFDTAVSYPGASYYQMGITLGDLDGDGKIDLFSSSGIFPGVVLSKNTSSPGQFSFANEINPVAPRISGSYGPVWSGDLDGDGKPDLVAISRYDANFQVYRNNLAEHGAWAGKDTLICAGKSITIGRPATLINQATGYTYFWASSPAGFTSSIANPVVGPSVTTKYSVAVTDPFGCTTQDSITVNVGGPAPAENAGADKYICEGGAVVIGSSGPAVNTYSWTSSPAGFTSSSLNPQVSPPAGTTNYYLTINTGTCSVKDTVVVSVATYPRPDAGPDRTICGKGSVALGTSTASPYDTYNWTSDPAGLVTTGPNPVVSPLTTTRYILSKNNGGCIATDTTVVRANPRPPADAGRDTSICSGAAVMIGATAADTSLTNTYIWSSNPNGFFSSQAHPSVSPTVTTRYYILVNNGLCTARDTTLIIVSPSGTPSVHISTPDSTLCTGVSAVFTAVPVNGGTTPSYRWQVNGSDAGTNSNIFSSNSLPDGAKIKAILTSNATCVSPATATSNTITMAVKAFFTPSAVVTGNTILNPGQSTGLSCTTTNGGSGPGYQWQDSTHTRNWTNIGGATDATLIYVPSATGDKVRCQLTSNDPCANPATVNSAPLVFTLNIPTAVTPVPGINKGIHIFPNPVSTTLTIDTLDLSDQWETLEVISISGHTQFISQEISNQTSVSVSVARLSKGFYIAVLRNKKGYAVYLKFIKI